MRDTVNVAWFGARAAAPSQEPVWETARNLFCNVSQNVDRVGATKGLGTFTRNACYYSFEHDTTVSSAVHMAALGWPRSYAARSSDGRLRDLSGDAVSVPIICLIEEVLFANPYAHWWKNPRKK